MAGLHRITPGFAEWTAHDCIERPLDTARSHLGCLVLASVAYVMASQGSTGANCDEAMRTSLQGTGDKVGSVVALSVLVSPLFLFKKGNDVAYQPGTRVTVYTNEKVDVRAWRR
jgi:hypothetical protein